MSPSKQMNPKQMKLPLLVSLIALTSVVSLVAAPQENWVETYGRLLKTYVTPTGVKYSEWKKNDTDVKALAGVTEAIGKKSADSLGKNEQLAFYINAYNAWILHNALEKYPTSSVQDTFFRFFTADNIPGRRQANQFQKTRRRSHPWKVSQSRCTLRFELCQPELSAARSRALQRRHPRWEIG